jgi:hypothetical protein
VGSEIAVGLPSGRAEVADLVGKMRPATELEITAGQTCESIRPVDGCGQAAWLKRQSRSMAESYNGFAELRRGVVHVDCWVDVLVFMELPKKGAKSVGSTRLCAQHGRDVNGVQVPSGNTRT